MLALLKREEEASKSLINDMNFLMKCSVDLWWVDEPLFKLLLGSCWKFKGSFDANHCDKVLENLLTSYELYAYSSPAAIFDQVRRIYRESLVQKLSRAPIVLTNPSGLPSKFGAFELMHNYAKTKKPA